MSGTVTAEAIEAAMRLVLPRIDASSVTVGVLVTMLAAELSVDEEYLRAEWKPTIKRNVVDMIDLCANESAEQPGGSGSEEDEADAAPKRLQSGVRRKRRNLIPTDSDAADEDDDGDDYNDSGSESEKAASGDEVSGSDDSGDEAPSKRRRLSEHKSSKQASRKRSSPEKKPKMKDSPGLAALKALGRAAGALNPQLYKRLNAARSVEEAEDIVRDRLQDAGVRFNGSYPSSRDISAAKKKRDREKELEGMDTSLIIPDSGRSRRSAAQKVSYKEAPIEDIREDELVDDNGGQQKEQEASEEEEEEASNSDSSEASF